MGYRRTLVALVLQLQVLVVLQSLQEGDARRASRAKREAKQQQHISYDARLLTSSGRDPTGGTDDPTAAAQAALHAVAGDAAQQCRVDRLPTITTSSFLSEYFHKKPLILTNITENAPVRWRWTLDYLAETYGNKKVSFGSPYAESVVDQPTRREKLGKYISRLKEGKAAGGAEYIWNTVSREFFSEGSDESWVPRSALRDPSQPVVAGANVTVGGLSQLMDAWERYDSWSDDYQWQANQPARVVELDDSDGTVLLSFVADRHLWSSFEAFHARSSMGSDVPLFALGGPDSGIPFHFHKDGYAEVLWGRKLWGIYPPMQVAPGHNRFSTHSQWIREVLPEITVPEARPMHCVQEPGEVYYIPEGCKRPSTACRKASRICD